jgi:hypothetical protein
VNTELNVCDITTGKKSYPVVAKAIIGQLAIHRPINGDQTRWVITHIKSGGIIIHVRTLPKARLVATDLDKLDWSKVRGLNSKKALAILAPQRAEILLLHGIYGIYI